MADPTVRWTPAEGWLMTEVARRALAVSLDGGLFVPADLTVVQDHEELRLELRLDASQAIVRLDDATPAGHRWRSGWLLEVAHGDERWMLSEEAREVAIADARREPVIVRPRIQQRALARELAGSIENVPIADVACHKYTRQSTTTPDDITTELAPWAAPTLPEAAPWWELDLARSMYVAWLRVDLANLDRSGTRVVIRAYAFVTPDGSPPSDSIVFDAPADQLAIHEGQVAIAIAADVVARLVRVELIGLDDTKVVLAVTSAEVLAAELAGGSLELTLRKSFALFRDRPLFVSRDGTPLVTYNEIWTRAVAFARGIASRGERLVGTDGPPMLQGRGVLALLLRSRPEWLVADLAGLLRGYVSVPISPDESDDRLAFILSRAPATCIVCEAADAARLARIAPRAVVIACDDPTPAGFDAVLADGATATDTPPLPRDPDDLYAVLFTSGSTGSPKGAMRTFATFFSMIASYQVGHSPRHLSFQPLSHLSERMYFPSLMIHGGTVAFSRGGAHLLEELRAFEPTTIGSVPRLFEVLHASYRRRLRSLLAAEPAASRGELEHRALAEARAAFGTRLSAISIGSAPVSPEVFGFLKRCFADIWVSEGYGSTEVGTIATDGKISQHADVKLVPLPETTDPDRGEIWVKSPHAIAGYLGDEAATSAAFDAAGYFATGDLGQRDAEGRVRVVGRLRNTVKLAQGEFVSAERIETALASCPLVDRIYVHAASGAVGVAALVVPHADVLGRALSPSPSPSSSPSSPPSPSPSSSPSLSSSSSSSSSVESPDLATLAANPAAVGHVLAALRATARTAGLAAYETPRGVIVEGAQFTVETGLITGNGKLARAAIAARYGAQLAALVAGAPEPTDAQIEDDSDEADLRSRVVRVATLAIGRTLAIDEPLASAGVDSLASAEILAALSDELGRDVPLTWWFEARTLGDLATRLAHFAEVSGPAQLRDLATADLGLPAIVSNLATTRADLMSPPPRHALLTGATGFLGAHLVGELTARGLAVTCLVRAAPDDAAAMTKLRAALASRELVVPSDVRAIAGDLAAPGAGLADRELDVDSVVHAGATVSWLASYAALREPNVLGTYALLELAAQRGWTFHHVSTISTSPRDGDETSSLTFESALAGTPYGLSKWIAEQHVVRAGVAKTIYRPAMIAGHTRSGVGNADDFTCRYLAGCIELGIYVDREDAIMDMTPVDHVAGAIAACVGRPAIGETIHLTNIGGSMTFGAVGRALAASGRAVRPATYAEFRETLQRSKTSRLHALGAFFPMTFSLGSGPWPSVTSLGVLAEVGLPPPKIDEEMIARYVKDLARHGHVR